MPLASRTLVIFAHWGAAVTVAPGVAVTNAHNANLLPAADILAISADHDLLFFRTARSTAVPVSDAYVGEKIIAFGQGGAGDLRAAPGVVRLINADVPARCSACRPQMAVVYDADAGPGFSGGPVVDAQTGALVGITFAYRPHAGSEGRSEMYAYASALVLAEMHALVGGGDPVR